MALTVTPAADAVTASTKLSLGSHFGVIAAITFDSSYPTGGEALGTAELTKLDLSQIDFVIPVGNVLGNRHVVYDRANKKLMLFTALGTEAVNASDQSTIIVNCLVIGK